MTIATCLQSLNDIIRGSEPEVLFVIGRTYKTLGCFCKDGATRHQSATVIGQRNDHMNRLWLICRYSDGHVDQVTDKGKSGLGYPHATDLVLQ